MNKKIHLIDYGFGNLASVKNALEFLNYNCKIIDQNTQLNNITHLILPGVGSFEAGIKTLKKQKWDKRIKMLVKNKVKLLGICLGMQLLCDYTEEGGVNGLGIIQGKVRRFSDQVKVPQMGWNTISETQTTLFQGIKDHEFMYLVHSYFVPLLPETIAVSTYNQTYSVALQKDNFYGVQFHPEKSSKAGQQLLKNFLNLTI